MNRPSLSLAPAPAEPPDLLDAFAAESLEGLDTYERGLRMLSEFPHAREALMAMLAPLHTLRCNAATLGLKAPGKVATRLEALVEGARKREFLLDTPALHLLGECLCPLRRYFQQLLLEADSPGASPSHQQIMLDDSLGHLEERLETELRRLNGSAPPPAPPIGELLVQQGGVQRDDLERALELQNQPTGALLVALGLTTPAQLTHALHHQRAAGPARTTLRTEATRVDALTVALAELVQTMGCLEDRLPGWRLIPEWAALRRQTRNIWDELLGMRTSSLEPLLQRLVHHAHQLAPQYARTVQVLVSGGELVLEQECINALSVSLPHAIRNALEHGFESPSERVARGKPAAGLLSLKASIVAGSLVIDVEDDGAGLPPKAVGMSPGQTPSAFAVPLEPLDGEAFFAPGFSTRPADSPHKGCGMGLTAIREAVERFGGRACLESHPGIGTRLRLSLPCRPPYLAGMVVRSGGRAYVLPTEQVVEYVRPTEQQCRSHSALSPMLHLRGQPLPLLWLETLLGRCPPRRALWQSLVAVIETQRGRLGLVVEELAGPQQLPLARIPGDGADAANKEKSSGTGFLSGLEHAPIGQDLPGSRPVLLHDGELAEMLELSVLLAGSPH